MDKEIAEYLLSELEKKAVIPDKDEFMELLLFDTVVPESPDFYSRIENNSQRIDEEDKHHYISIRRVLRNAGARDYRPSRLKSMSNGFYDSVHGFAGYSSDLMAEKARTDYEISRVLSHSSRPYSLLGKLITHRELDDKTKIVVTKPILAVPGGDLIEIANWELNNAKIEHINPRGNRKRCSLRSFR